MKTQQPTLYIFSGLPGTGKTTLAQKLCSVVDSCYLRIDTIEQLLRDTLSIPVEEEGYLIAFRLASDNLTLGRHVIADSCNPVHRSRSEWQKTAERAGAKFINIEIVCSSNREHRRRLESRRADIAGLSLPTWNDVKNREYHVWTNDRVIIDTTGKTPDQSTSELLEKLNRI